MCFRCFCHNTPSMEYGIKRRSVLKIETLWRIFMVECQIVRVGSKLVRDGMKSLWLTKKGFKERPCVMKQFIVNLRHQKFLFCYNSFSLNPAPVACDEVCYQLFRWFRGIVGWTVPVLSYNIFWSRSCNDVSEILIDYELFASRGVILSRLLVQGNFL